MVWCYGVKDGAQGRQVRRVRASRTAGQCVGHAVMWRDYFGRLLDLTRDSWTESRFQLELELEVDRDYNLLPSSLLLNQHAAIKIQNLHTASIFCQQLRTKPDRSQPPIMLIPKATSCAYPFLDSIFHCWQYGPHSKIHCFFDKSVSRRLQVQREGCESAAAICTGIPGRRSSIVIIMIITLFSDADHR